MGEDARVKTGSLAVRRTTGASKGAASRPEHLNPLLVVPLVLVGCLLLPSESIAGLTLQEVSSGVVAKSGPEAHPKRVEQVIRVERDLNALEANLLLGYWRTELARPDKGRVTVKVEILRPGNGEEPPTTLLQSTAKGSVSLRRFGHSIALLPELLEGDLILISFRLRRMPRIPLYDVAFVEALLETND